jgi:hypothetical protein
VSGAGLHQAYEYSGVTVILDAHGNDLLTATSTAVVISLTALSMRVNWMFLRRPGGTSISKVIRSILGLPEAVTSSVIAISSKCELQREITIFARDWQLCQGRLACVRHGTRGEVVVSNDRQPLSQPLESRRAARRSGRWPIRAAPSDFEARAAELITVPPLAGAGPDSGERVGQACHAGADIGVAATLPC